MKKFTLLFAMLMLTVSSAWAAVGDEVVDLNNLSNDKCYVLQTPRGNWVYNPSDPTHLNGTIKSNITADATSPNQQWAILKSNKGNLYFYSVGGQKFVYATGNKYVMLSEDCTNSHNNFISASTSRITAGYPFVPCDGGHQFNMSTNQASGVLSNWNDINDEGNAHKIIEAGNFDSDEILATINAAEAVYTVVCSAEDGGVVYNSTTYNNGDVITPGTILTEDDLTVVEKEGYYGEVTIDYQNINVNYYAKLFKANTPYLVSIKNSNPAIYLDIVTDGYNDSKHNASLQAKGTPIYFTYTEGGKWKLNSAKDGSGNCLGANSWNTRIDDYDCAWKIEGDDSNGYTFNQQSAAYKGYLGNSSQTAGSPLYNNQNTEANIIKFLFEEITTHTVTYTYKYGDRTVGTVSVDVEHGDTYPAASQLPAYASVVDEIPTGTVEEDKSLVLQITYDLPFEYAVDAASISKWYVLGMHNTSNRRYFRVKDDGSILGDRTTVPTIDESAKNAYLWGFAGNPVDGFQVISYTTGRAIDNADPCTVNGEATKWKVYANSMAGAFALSIDGANYLNCQWDDNKNGLMNRWSTSDDGSGVNLSEATPYTLVAATMRITAAAKWGTFCAPYDVTIPAGVQAYTGTLITENEGNPWIRMNELTEGIIPANTGVVVWAKNLEADESWIFNEVPTLAEGLTSCYSTNLTNSIMNIEEGAYLLQKQEDVVGWYKVEGTGFTLAPNRCYLAKNTVPEASQARSFIGFEPVDDATGINSIATEAATKADGKYMVNGQIVVVKAGKAYNMSGTEIK